MQTGIYQGDTEKVNYRRVSTPADSRTAIIEAQRATEQEAKASAMLEPTPAWKIAALKEIYASSDGDHCRTLLAAMRKCGSVSTLECRRWLDIPHPAGRVLNLTQDGYIINRRWVKQASERGRCHRVVSYSIGRDLCVGEVHA